MICAKDFTSFSAQKMPISAKNKNLTPRDLHYFG
ncbi:MAG: hypothetical protein RL281_471, partial [Pseudomonadota bacterium]